MSYNHQENKKTDIYFIKSDLMLLYTALEL